jgi:hypothetical protein
VDYTTIRDTLTKQKEWVLERIRQRSSSHIVRAGIPAFQEGQPPKVLDYKDIPGLCTPSSILIVTFSDRLKVEAGWTAHPTAQEM